MCKYRAWGYSLVFTLGSAVGQAQIYQSVDVHGTVVFSDVAQANSQPYSLAAANISGFNGAAAMPDSLVLTKESGNVTAAASVASTYSVSIVQPQDQSTIHDQAPIAVMVSLQPNLKTGDSLQLLVDGLPTGAPQTALQFMLQDLIRGTHQLQVRILDVNGQTLKMSLPITLFKQQASVLLPTTPPA